jgi:phenylacetate-CoA ligase
MTRFEALPHWITAVAGLFQSNDWSREQLIEYQNTRLRSLLRHAYKNVRYYRRLFDTAGLKPQDIRTVHDLPLLPTTSKAAITSVPAEDVVAEGFATEHLLEFRTSGTTGERFTTRRTPTEDYLLGAFRLRSLFECGMRLTDRRATVRSVDPTDPQPKRGRLQPLSMRLGILPKEDMDCVLETEEMMARLRAIQPQVLTGYAGTLAWIASQLTEADRIRIRPRIVFAGGEPVTAGIRRVLRTVFRCPVYDLYGANEFNLVAWECPSTGSFHLCEDNLVAEVLRDGIPAKPGEEGELVGTALHCYAMPLIRFRLGDVVVQGEERCPCGAPYATIGGIHGRVMDRFLLPSGRSIHPFAVMNPMLERTPWLRQYEVRQREGGLITILMVPNTPPPAGDPERIAAAVSAEVGQDVRVEIELVSRIEPGSGGKYRPFQPFSPQSGADHNGNALSALLTPQA